MSLVMPDLDRAVLDRRTEIAAALRRIVPGEGVIDSANEMRPYESDGLTAYREPPMLVVLPETAEQVVDEDVRVEDRPHAPHSARSARW